MNHESSEPIRLAGRTLTHVRHICAFFNSRDEQNKTLMPFFKDAYDRGEKVFHIIDSRLHHDHVRSCQDYGIDVESAQKSGQLEIKHWEDAYLKDGHFNSDRMIRTLEIVLEQNRGKYKLCRLMGNMEWALETLPGVTDIIEYESKVNYVMSKYPDPVICAYDLNRHSGSVVMDILRTHPMVIIGGLLQENPLYVPPDEFLKDIRRRKEISARKDSAGAAPVN